MEEIDKIIFLLKETTKNIIVENLKITIDEKSDFVNNIINSIFEISTDKKVIFVRVVFVFLMIYTEFVNNEIELETKKIYLYVKFYGNFNYKINYNIIDSVYVIVASLLETYSRPNIKNFLTTFDRILTKNIKKYQEDKRIDYDPHKTPVICDILKIMEPIFDSVDLYDKIK